MKALAIAVTMLLACDLGLFRGAHASECLSMLKTQLDEVTAFANKHTRLL